MRRSQQNWRKPQLGPHKLFIGNDYYYYTSHNINAMRDNQQHRSLIMIKLKCVHWPQILSLPPDRKWMWRVKTWTATNWDNKKKDKGGLGLQQQEALGPLSPSSTCSLTHCQLTFPWATRRGQRVQRHSEARQRPCSQARVSGSIPDSLVLLLHSEHSVLYKSTVDLWPH